MSLTIKDCVMKLFEKPNDENAEIRQDQRPCTLFEMYGYVISKLS